MLHKPAPEAVLHPKWSRWGTRGICFSGVSVWFTCSRSYPSTYKYQVSTTSLLLYYYPLICIKFVDVEYSYIQIQLDSCCYANTSSPHYLVHAPHYQNSIFVYNKQPKKAMIQHQLIICRIIWGQWSFTGEFPVGKQQTQDPVCQGSLPTNSIVASTVPGAQHQLCPWCSGTFGQLFGLLWVSNFKLVQ